VLSAALESCEQHCSDCLECLLGNNGMAG